MASEWQLSKLLPGRTGLHEDGTAIKRTRVLCHGQHKGRLFSHKGAGVYQRVEPHPHPQRDACPFCLTIPTMLVISPLGSLSLFSDRQADKVQVLGKEGHFCESISDDSSPMIFAR
ncbi:unnamed protein product [Arctogadus glacialis]